MQLISLAQFSVVFSVTQNGWFPADFPVMGRFFYCSNIERLRKSRRTGKAFCWRFNFLKLISWLAQKRGNVLGLLLFYFERAISGFKTRTKEGKLLPRKLTKVYEFENYNFWAKLRMWWNLWINYIIFYNS